MLVNAEIIVVKFLKLNVSSGSDVALKAMIVSCVALNNASSLFANSTVGSWKVILYVTVSFKGFVKNV